MEKYEVTYTIKSVLGTFTRMIEVNDTDTDSVEKELNRLLEQDGILLDNKVPKVKQIILVVQH